MSDQVETYWQAFLKATKRPQTTPYFEAFYFGHGEKMANELLALVMAETKTATCSSSLAYEGDGARAPQVGDLSIVTDWSGRPFCIIETKAITRLKFSQMTYDICRREGEDETLESWQANHQTFFQNEGRELGYEFSWEMPVLFEDFEVVYR